MGSGLWGSLPVSASQCISDIQVIDCQFFKKKFSLLNEVISSVPNQDLFLFNYFIYFFFNPKSLCGSVQDWPVSFIIVFSGTLIQSNPCFPQPTCTIKKLRSPCFSSLTNILQQNDFRTLYSHGNINIIKTQRDTHGTQIQMWVALMNSCSR